VISDFHREALGSFFQTRLPKAFQGIDNPFAHAMLPRVEEHQFLERPSELVGNA
jgi:hypothetical protein